ncbi:MAG: universal stress protein [Proteobacteria bacterium]|nr:universal stress protein [Pseudomonadota bacterium]
MHGAAPVIGTIAPARATEPSYIMAVTRNGHMSEHVMEYAATVAQRLGYGILAVHVDTLPLFNRGRRSRLFAAAMQESAAQLTAKAQHRGVAVEHVGEFGKIGNVIGRLCRSKKHIEFVVIDKGIRQEAAARSAPVSVFTVKTAQESVFRKPLSHTSNPKGVFAMSAINKKQHLLRCAIFGTLTAALYAAVFSCQGLVMTYFCKGGLYALLPVATVFAVSYFHGNFTGSFWSALGIEASKQSTQVATQKQATETVKAPRRDTRPRLQVNV